MKIERVSCESLTFDPHNVREHDQRNVDAIKASLSRFGQQKPIVVDAEGVVIAGNGTLGAARLLGWDEIDIVRTHLSGAEAVAYAVADNRTAELADWDEAALALVLDQLDSEQLEATGYTESELEALLDDLEPKDGVKEDEPPEPPADPITKPGDLWLLGRHRLLCGDSTNKSDVERLMAGEKADLIWTDPPYGVNHIGGTKDPRRKTYRTGGVVYNDEKTGSDLVWLVSSSISNIPCHDATVLYMASPAGSHVREMIDAFNASGFKFRHSLVWVKSAFVFGRADYHYQHELILYGWGERHEWSGPRNLSTVLEFPRGDKTIDHPTSKPLGLVVATAQNHPAITMADPFLGSGTTLIAAEQLGRKCYGMELSPAYCDVIVQRWENLTGKKAERQPAA